MCAPSPSAPIVGDVVPAGTCFSVPFSLSFSSLASYFSELTCNLRFFVLCWLDDVRFCFAFVPGIFDVLSRFATLSEATPEADGAHARATYEEMGAKLRERDCAELQAINRCIEDVYVAGAKPLPFILIDGPSGVGKTQTAFALRRKVEYLVLSPPGDGGQHIYAAFEGKSKCFRDAVRLDLLAIGEDGYSTTSLSVFNCPLYSAAIVANILGKDCTTPFSIPDLRSVVRGLGESLLPVFVLDETPVATGENKKFVAFARNLFRVVGLVVVMMGTDSSVANMVQNAGSRGSTETVPWAHLFVDLPRYLRSAHVDESKEAGGGPPVNADDLNTEADEVRAYVLAEMTTARPLFVTLMFDYLTHTSAPTWDGISAFVWERLGKKKSPGWWRGQVCMFYPAYHAAEMTGHAATQSFVTSHLAYLERPNVHFPSPFKLVLKNSDICFEDQPWLPRCLYPTMEVESILYLALMGGAHGRRPFENGKTSRVAIDNVIKLMKTSDIDDANPVASSRSGNYLEGIGMTAMCVASHIEGCGGVNIVPFLEALCVELSTKYSSSPSSNLGDLVAGVLPGGLKVPYLFPLAIAGRLQTLKNANFGVICRPQNAAMVDFVVVDGFLYGECKNLGCFALATLKKVLLRVKPVSKVHVVVCESLQDSYFNKEDYGAWVNSTCQVMKSSLLLRCQPLNQGADCFRFEPLKVNQKNKNAEELKRIVLFLPLGEDKRGNC